MKTSITVRQTARRIWLVGYLWRFPLLCMLGLTGVTQAQNAPCTCPSVEVKTESGHRAAQKAPSKSDQTARIEGNKDHKQARPDKPLGVVNINTATEAELERLPAVGPSRAKAIVMLRARLGGRFKRIEQIIRVRGIGRKIFRKLAPMLALQGPTTLIASPKR